MLVRRSAECRPFVAGDGSLLEEILHPAKTPVKIRYSLARARVDPGQKTMPHMLDHAEVYYILAGRGSMHINAETTEVGRGDTIYIPPGQVQFIENDAEDTLEFLCIVDPAWEQRIERVMSADHTRRDR